MKLVKDIMTTEVISVNPETGITEAAKLLLEKRVNGLPVVDGRGHLVGILTQSDLIAQQKRFPVPSLFTMLGGFFPLGSTAKVEKELHKMAAATVGEAMTSEVVTVTPETTVEEAATLMVEKKYHTLPVVDGDLVVGVVGKEDVLRTVL